MQHYKQIDGQSLYDLFLTNMEKLHMENITALTNLLHATRSKLTRQQQAVHQTIQLIKTLEEEIQRMTSAGSKTPTTK